MSEPSSGVYHNVQVQVSRCPDSRASEMTFARSFCNQHLPTSTLQKFSCFCCSQQDRNEQSHTVRDGTALWAAATTTAAKDTGVVGQCRGSTVLHCCYCGRTSGELRRSCLVPPHLIHTVTRCTNYQTPCSTSTRQHYPPR
jgi:hypothetical protein